MSTAITEDNINIEREQASAIWGGFEALSKVRVAAQAEVVAAQAEVAAAQRATEVANGKIKVLKEIKKPSNYDANNQTFILSETKLKALVPNEDLRARVVESILGEEEDEDEKYSINESGDLVVTEKSATSSQETVQEPVGVGN